MACKTKDNSEHKSHSDILIELGMSHIKTFFVDQYKEPYVQTSDGLIYKINSIDFERWLGGFYYASEDKGCDKTSIKTACDTLSAHAIHQGAGEIPLHCRVARHDGALFYDLGDHERCAIRITPQGWDVTKEVPILFRRYRNQAPQIVPICDGDVREFLRFINVKDQHTQLLILVWIIASYIPDFPHPILIVHGSQGSAKSSFCRYLKGLIDPGVCSTESISRKDDELVRKLHNQWISVFDNINKINQSQSDYLCRAVTGDGYSARALYTDNEEFMLKFQRVIVLNGINICAISPDILDRSIIVELDRIPSEQRKTEDLLNEKYKRALPGILGGVLDILSKAVALYPEVKGKLKNLPRMADFAMWGFAIAEALGGYGDDFLKAYHSNIGLQHETVIDSHPVAQALIKFMEDKGEWKGYPGELLQELTKSANELGINTNHFSWPKQPNYLTKRINELKATLKDTGIQEITSKHTAFGNHITISKPKSTMKVMKVNEDNDDLSKLAPEANLEGNEGNEGAFLKKCEKENVDIVDIKVRENTFSTFIPSSSEEISGSAPEDKHEDTSHTIQTPSSEMDYELF